MNKNSKNHEICYICTETIDSADQDRDHVLPKNLFNVEDREDGLIILPTHKKCNGCYSKDDEHFRLLISAKSFPDAKARRLWDGPVDRGPVMRGFHRRGSEGFKASILNTLAAVEVRTESGLYLGSGEAMLVDEARMDRLVRVINRIIRGLFTHETKEILPKDWPVQSAMMEPSKLEEFLDLLKVRFASVGNGTVYYAWKCTEDDSREGFFWLIFYNRVHFWGVTGSQLLSLLDEA